jgi:hypothetical protein
MEAKTNLGDRPWVVQGSIDDSRIGVRRGCKLNIETIVHGQEGGWGFVIKIEMKR